MNNVYSVSRDDRVEVFANLRAAISNWAYIMLVGAGEFDEAAHEEITNDAVTHVLSYIDSEVNP